MTAIQKVQPVVEKVLVITAVMIAAAGLGLLAVNSWEKIYFRFHWNYVESAVLTVIKNFSAEPLLYHDFQFSPYILNPYTPLYYWASIFLSRFFGDGFVCGRLLSVASTIGLLGCFFLIIRRHLSGKTTAFLFSAILALNPSVGGYWVEMRPDLMALFFQIAGIFCLFEGERGPSERVIFRSAAFLCFLLARSRLYSSVCVVNWITS